MILALAACGDPKPVATGKKAPGLKPLNSAAPATGATPTAGAQSSGDATKGQTALTTSCNICHGKTAHALTKADVSKVDNASKTPDHTAVAAAFKASSADIKAYLATK